MPPAPWTGSGQLLMTGQATRESIGESSPRQPPICSATTGVAPRAITVTRSTSFLVSFMVFSFSTKDRVATSRTREAFPCRGIIPRIHRRR